MLSMIYARMYAYAMSTWGLIIAAAFAGEYFKPARMISDLLDRVRGE